MDPVEAIQATFFRGLFSLIKGLPEGWLRKLHSGGGIYSRPLREKVACHL